MNSLRLAILAGGMVPLAASSCDAAVFSAAYSVEASMFEDSANNPPAGPSTTSISGQFRFLFDTSSNLTTTVPDAVSGIEIVNSDGVINVYDPSTSGVFTHVNFAPGLTRVSFGGNNGTPQFMAGLSDDFRVIFDINTLTGQVDSVNDDFTYVTRRNPFLVSQTTTVSLIDFSPANADLDNDGDVDGLDFLIIQRTDPSLIPLWQSQYGMNPLAAASVPEPACWVLALAGVPLALSVRRRCLGC